MPRPLVLLAAAALALGAGCGPAADPASTDGAIAEAERIVEAEPIAGPAAGPDDSATLPDPPAGPDHAAADVIAVALEAHGDAQTSGRVTLTATADGVLVSADLDRLEPDGLRALHVHEGGSCARPGGLFNPTGAPHGAPTRALDRRPPGALGNLSARADGSARYERVEPLVSLAARANDPASLVGRTVVVHAAQDDFHSLPEGAPGPIVACGVIRPS